MPFKKEKLRSEFWSDAEQYASQITPRQGWYFAFFFGYHMTTVSVNVRLMKVTNKGKIVDAGRTSCLLEWSIICVLSFPRFLFLFGRWVGWGGLGLVGYWTSMRDRGWPHEGSRDRGWPMRFSILNAHWKRIAQKTELKVQFYVPKPPTKASLCR